MTGRAHFWISGSNVTVRRSTRLLLAPIVLAGLAWVAVHGALIDSRSGGTRVVVFSALVGLYWVVTAVADYFKRLVISDDLLQMHGYLGGSLTLRREEAVACAYVRYRAREHGAIELYFFEIRDVHGNRLKIWRYGWGRQSHRLFATLQQWLSTSSADMSPAASRTLDRLSS